MAVPTLNTTFGATIIPSPHRSHEPTLLSPATLESPAVLTPTVSHDGSMPDAGEHAFSAGPKPLSPFSAFYQHPPASFERVHSRANSKTNLGIGEKDLESGAVTPLSQTDENPFGSKVQFDHHAGAASAEDKMWPSRQTLILERKAERRKRRENTWCAPARDRWSGMNRKQRLACKVGLAFFTLGVAVAVGVGISVALHGGYYTSQGNSNQVGHS